MPHSSKRKHNKADYNNLDLDRDFNEVWEALLTAMKDGSIVEATIKEFGIEKSKEILNADIDTAIRIISDHFKDEEKSHR